MLTIGLCNRYIGRCYRTVKAQCIQFGIGGIGRQTTKRTLQNAVLPVATSEDIHIIPRATFQNVVTRSAIKVIVSSPRLDTVIAAHSDNSVIGGCPSVGIPRAKK